MRYVTLIVLILAPLALAGDAEKLPDTRAEAAKIRYEKSLIDAKTVYHATVAKAEADYIVELEGAIKRATTAERFDAAKVLMGEKETVGRMRFAGRWTNEGDTITVMPNGTITRSTTPNDIGQWSHEGDHIVVRFAIGVTPVWRVYCTIDGRYAVTVRSTATGADTRMVPIQRVD